MEIIETIEDNIHDLLKNKKKIIIAIEGKAAAGKTTLAQYLKEKFSAHIIQMDDFFLPKELRTDDRYKIAGGNIHYERFKKEVIDCLDDKVVFKTYNCQLMDYDQIKKIENYRVLIIEGSYSLHPYLTGYYDLSIFLDIDEKLQKERIIKRNGLKQAQQFFERWIPLENHYFDFFNIKLKADYILS